MGASDCVSGFSILHIRMDVCISINTMELIENRNTHTARLSQFSFVTRPFYPRKTFRVPNVILAYENKKRDHK
jgi:hypothetical protein